MEHERGTDPMDTRLERDEFIALTVAFLNNCGVQASVVFDSLELIDIGRLVLTRRAVRAGLISEEL